MLRPELYANTFDRGIDYVRGSLNWGPFTFLNGVSKTFGWWTNWRRTFADGFHKCAREWDADFMRDSRLTYMLYLRDTRQLGRFPGPGDVASRCRGVQRPSSNHGWRP